MSTENTVDSALPVPPKGDQGDSDPADFPDGVTVKDAERITELAEEDRRSLIHYPYESK